jgi:TonB family protein
MKILKVFLGFLLMLLVFIIFPVAGQKARQKLKESNNDLEIKLKLYNDVIQNIVVVKTPCGEGIGFVLSRETVVTSRQIVECEKGEGSLKLLISQKGYSYKEKYLADSGIAILKVPELNPTKPFTIEGRNTKKIGDTAYVLGLPLLLPESFYTRGQPINFDRFYSRGKITSIEASYKFYLDLPSFDPTTSSTVPINAVNSVGSPVFNSEGAVIGLISTNRKSKGFSYNGITAQDVIKFQKEVNVGKVQNLYGKGINADTSRGSGIGSGFGNSPILLQPPVEESIPLTSSSSQYIKEESIQIISKPRATYTKAAEKNLIEGLVKLRVTFLASGKIGAISIISGLPDGLTEQAIKAAQQIHFNPAKRNGVTITVTKIVQYEFKFTD